jgi:linoleate 8R-lipoxygenase/9,12-octadecadienoate 8-hydroperoxide 8R-isomerase
MQTQPGALPDPGDIFDSVMTRKHKEPHPNKISSMLFYLASIIIHDLFRTDHKNFYNSKTSSYLDLSPLYGSNLEEQFAMRTREAGKLKPDCFSESRLLMFPPGVGAILIMFNRFHNSVVEMLQTINQANQFTPPKDPRPKGAWPTLSRSDEKYPKEWAAWYDHDHNLFNTARLVTCGLYINIILIDYVRTILNLNKTDSNWALDPRANMPDVEVASGNQVSAEFNLVYRWHSTLSERDEKWTEQLWKTMFPGQDPATIDWHTFVVLAEQKENEMRGLEPPARNFAGLERDKATGKLSDDDLVAILADSIEDCANSFGANRVPPVMRVFEILGINQARAWNGKWA